MQNSDKAFLNYLDHQNVPLERLKEERFEAIQERERMVEERKLLALQVSNLDAQILALNARIKKENIPILTDWKKDVRVSDHAILRFLERSKNINMDHVRHDLIASLPNKIIEGTGAIKTAGMIYKVAYDGKKIIIVTAIRRK